MLRKKNHYTTKAKRLDFKQKSRDAFTFNNALKLIYVSFQYIVY